MEYKEIKKKARELEIEIEGAQELIARLDKTVRSLPDILKKYSSGPGYPDPS